MNALMRIAGLRLWGDRAAARLAQYGSYTAAVVVFVMSLKALARVGASPAEFLIGLLAACALAVAMVALGTVTALYEEVRRR